MPRKKKNPEVNGEVKRGRGRPKNVERDSNPVLSPIVEQLIGSENAMALAVTMGRLNLKKPAASVARDLRKTLAKSLAG